MSGELIGHRYRVLRKIGEGGMAVVHIAVDEKLGRDVAIKILKERFENHDEIRVRFQHEARAISTFDHPNILKIFDFSGEASKQLWIVTELIHGRNVAQILETTPSGWLHPVIAASIVREICRALSTAHEYGVVHRDVKPENVMITHQGSVKLMDFGIAKIQRVTSMTQTGMFMGSPSYMSPEQVRGRDVDHRSDVYSLGVLFYELVTGKLPYTGSSTADIAMKILGGEFSHPKFVMAGIPSEISDCIVNCLELLPENRPQSIEEVGRQMDQLLQSLGLESSMQELERCFKDPRSYGDRLAKVLKVTTIKPAPTVIESSAGIWNREAISSPIPRPDISGENLPQGSTRRDHLLPSRSVPHFSKKPASPDMIAAHLPERRHQQREHQPTNHIDATQRLASPPHPVAPRPRSLDAPARPRNQLKRDIRPLSRVVPVAPKKIHKVRYVIRENQSYHSGGSGFGKFIAALLVVASSAILWMGTQRNSPSQNRQGISQSTKPKKTNGGIVPQKTTTTSRPQTKSEQAQNNAQVPEPPKQVTPSQPTPTASVMIPESKPKEETQDKGSNSRNNNGAGTKIGNNKKTRTDQPSKFVTSERDSSKTNPSSAAKDLPLAAPSSTSISAISPPIPAAIMKPVSNPQDSLDTEDVAAAPIARKTTEKRVKTAPQELTGRGVASIASMPAAELYIDGKRFGTTNDLGTSSEWIELPSGTHRVELKRSGFTTRIETINVSTGGRHKLGPFTLQRGQSDAAKTSTYRLTLATNILPADVNITNIETRANQTVTLTQLSQTLNLDRGIYEVSMRHKGDTRKRRIDLSGAAQQLTFSVEFKD